MGNVNQGQRTHLFDRKRFKQMINQQQQNQIQQQENSQQQLFNQFRCLQVNHNDKQIEGVCVNEDCKAQNRRTCYDCIIQRIHERDYNFSFQSTQPLNADQLSNLIIYQKGILNEQIDQLFYCLYLEQLQLTNENDEEIACLKVQELEKIEKGIKQLKEITDQINISDYILKQNQSNMGIMQYFQQFYDKISQISESQNVYFWLKQNANSVIHHFIITRNHRLVFQEIKKNKYVIINKITETLKYQNNEIEQKDIIFLQQQIKEVCELGKIFHHSDQYELAIQCFELQLRYNPNDYDTLLRIGNTFYNLKRFEHAIEQYNNVLRLKPALKLAIMQKGNSMNNLLRFERSYINV